MTTVAQAVHTATATLAAAGVASPLFDAQSLAAYVLDCSRMDLFLQSDSQMPAEFDELLARRIAREPLQHILGTAPMGHLDLDVGPGVFVPRPETELMGEWAVNQIVAMGVDNPCVVDLCTGSGALALYIASLVPDANVSAVELDPVAATWTRRNIAKLGLDVRFELGDATSRELLTDLDGRCDVVVSNPPYVPEATPVAPEVRVDPHHAVFSGARGMDVIEKMIPVIHRLLKVGGVLAIEHDDTTAQAVCEQLQAHNGFNGIVSHKDLAGRDRFVTARKNSE